MLKGYIDVATAETLAGWVADTSNLTSSVNILVHVNGALAVSCACNIFRQDVFDAIGSGNHGFSFGLETYLRPGENSVSVEVEDSQFEFSNREFVITHLDTPQMVETGKTDWLFLKNDSNKTNEIIEGNLPLDEQMRTQLVRIFFYRELISKHYNTKFLQVIVPEKNVICNTQKNPPLTISNNRPSIQLMQDLDEASQRHTIYPIREFTEHSTPCDLFYKTDTHLSASGRIFLMDVILGGLGLERDFDYSLVPETFTGDLGGKFRPPITEAAFGIKTSMQHDCIHDTVSANLKSGGHLTGSVLYSQANTSRKSGRLYVYGTSSAYYLRGLLQAQFEEVLFVWSTALDQSIIKTFQPDFVLGILTERFLRGVPNDLAIETALNFATKYNLSS